MEARSASPGAGMIRLRVSPCSSASLCCDRACMARVVRLFDITFAPYPLFRTTVLQAAAIQGNVYVHRFPANLRRGLIAATVLLFARSRFRFRIDGRLYLMPRPLAAFPFSFHCGWQRNPQMPAGSAQIPFNLSASRGSEHPPQC